MAYAWGSTGSFGGTAAAREMAEFRAQPMTTSSYMGGFGNYTPLQSTAVTPTAPTATLNTTDFAGADPFAKERAGYQDQLRTGMTSGDPYGGWGEKMQALMSGEFSPTDPSYEWRMKQGLQAAERAGAAKGLVGSGNILTALTEYGQGMASQEYGNQFNRLYQLMGQSAGQFNATMDRLANLSGAQFNPAAPYQLGVQKYGIDVGAQTSLATASMGAQASMSNAATAARASMSNAQTSANLGYSQLAFQRQQAEAANQGAAAALQGFTPSWQQASSPLAAMYNAPNTTQPVFNPYYAGLAGGGTSYSGSYTTSPFVGGTSGGNVYDTEGY